jgi:5'-nucleotidase
MAHDSERPLIIFTNDDGIGSPGLWAVVAAFAGMGDLLVAAPRDQQSGMARSMPAGSSGSISEYEPPIAIENCQAYAIDGSPAQTVQHGVLELADRKPALAISGINYGDNTGNGVTISGTVGAALEAASLDIRAIAVSLQTSFDLHLTHSSEVDFSVAAHFTHMIGRWLIRHQALPDDVDLLKLDIPWEATTETDWRLTRISRRRVYWPTRPERKTLAGRGRMGYHYNTDPSKAEPDSDVYALMHDQVVSITPMSLNMSSRTDLFRLRQIIEGEREYGTASGAD